MAEQSNSNVITVSVVEDSVDYCKTLEMMINATPGFKCHSAHFNAESALEKIIGDPPDIVLIDLGLPKMSGTDCILELKTKLPNLHFLVLTIKNQDEEVFSALQAGASGYLLKSSSPSEIIDAIKELYDGGAPMSADVARKVVSHFRKKVQPKSPYEHLLTKREKEVLGLLALRKYYKEIASDLFISVETVKSHCHNIYDKLHVSSRTEALNKYYNR